MQKMSTTMTDDKGVVWEAYVVGFDTSEGPRLTVIYAVSPSHAQLVVEELRATAMLVGKIERKNDEQR